MDGSSETGGNGAGHLDRSAAAGKPRPQDDPQVRVRVFLIRRGAPARVVAGGLEGLIDEWERVGRDVAEGYPLDTLEDYLNDMDVRNLIHDAVTEVPPALDAVMRARLEDADRGIRSQLTPAAECLWGAEQAARERWNARERWWYFMRPAHPGPGLSEALGL